MALVLNDSFIYCSTSFDITEQQVLSTIEASEFRQDIEYDVSLFMKKISEDTKKSYLLVAVNSKEGNKTFWLAYWLPEKIVLSSSDLFSTLKNFARTFGQTFKLGDQVDRFIEHKVCTISTKYNFPHELINLSGPFDVPSSYHMYHEEQAITPTLFVYYFYYVFVINNFKYLAWLNSSPIIEIMVPKDIEEKISSIVDFLAPDGGTKITVLKPHKGDQISKEKQELVSVEILKPYKARFEHIISLLNKMDDKQQLVLTLTHSRLVCIFCNAKDVSREHIFPKWIRPYFAEVMWSPVMYYHKGNLSSETLLDKREIAVTSGHKVSNFGFTFGEICDHCNTGWMSVLEDQAKKILVGNEGSIVEDLSPGLETDQLTALARWLILKSLLIVNKDTQLFSHSRDTYDLLIQGKILEGFVIELSKANSYQLGFNASIGIDNLTPYPVHRITNFKIDDIRKMSADFLKVTFQVGKLLFRISYLPLHSLLKRERVCIPARTLYS